MIIVAAGSGMMRSDCGTDGEDRLSDGVNNTSVRDTEMTQWTGAHDGD